MPVMVSTCKASVLPRVEKFAKQYDIKIAIHTHGPEDPDFPSPYDVLKAVKGMDPRMGLCNRRRAHGTHGNRRGPRCCRRRPAPARHAHQGSAGSQARRASASSAEGVIPIPAIFRRLVAMRYPGYVNLEYEIDADDPLPA